MYFLNFLMIILIIQNPLFYIFREVEKFKAEALKQKAQNPNAYVNVSALLLILL